MPCKIKTLNTMLNKKRQEKENDMVSIKIYKNFCDELLKL